MLYVMNVHLAGCVVLPVIQVWTMQADTVYLWSAFCSLHKIRFHGGIMIEYTEESLNVISSTPWSQPSPNTMDAAG